MSDIRINSSPRPIPEQTEVSEGGDPPAPANTCAEQGKNPTADYEKTMQSGLPEHLLHQQGQGLKPDDLHLSNPVEAGMQSATEWLLRQGKLMQSEVEHPSDSRKHADSPGTPNDSTVEKK